MQRFQKHSYPKRRAGRQWARKWEIANMDKALGAVGGSFVLAAKVLDMTPERFRNLVHGSAPLRSKWGRKTRGPGVKVGFPVRPFCERPEYGLPLLKDLILDSGRRACCFSDADINQLILWLNANRAKLVTSSRLRFTAEEKAALRLRG